jgi:hypothetical protein
VQGFRLSPVMVLERRDGVVIAERESPDVIPMELRTPLMNGDEPLVSEIERFAASGLRAH